MLILQNWTDTGYLSLQLKIDKINISFIFQDKMSSKLGALKERSKSETSQNRVKLRRPPKYKSLTLTRQNAKLNVSVTSDGGHMTSTPKIKASEACTCEDCDPPCSNNINANNSSICYEDETSLNTSTSTLQRFWRSFRTPSPAIRRIQSTTDPKISRSTSVRYLSW